MQFKAFGWKNISSILTHDWKLWYPILVFIL